MSLNHPPITMERVMRSLTLNGLRSDKQELEKMLEGQKQTLAEQINSLKVEEAVATQAAILRMEGALTYVTRAIEHIEKQKREKEKPSDK